MASSHDHFKNKSTKPIQRQAHRNIASIERDGIEVSGSLSAGVDAARETIVFLLLLYIFAMHFSLTQEETLVVFFSLTLGWLIWKTGRSAWLGWSRLEYLHRILEAKRWEIEHNRTQEREELKVLYTAKGLEGKLLDDVLDVLMADGDRLLKIMVEEKLGLSLDVHEHPLQQAVGAFCGVLFSFVPILIGLWAWPLGGIYISALFILFLSSYLYAHFEGNQPIAAMVWVAAMVSLAIGSTYFLMAYVIQRGWLS